MQAFTGKSMHAEHSSMKPWKARRPQALTHGQEKIHIGRVGLSLSKENTKKIP